jgi:hypothetical protein
MANIRSVNEIILSLIDFYKLAQPNLDVKPGTVARDLFIEGPASQLSLIYDEAGSIADKSSLRLVIGNDLDKLAKNFAIVRKQSTTSTGVALLTFSSINATVSVNKGDVIVANNGLSYTVTVGTTITQAASNFYRSVATKFRDQLDFVGISDQYAAEVTVIASSAGSIGNIGKYSLSRTTINGVSNVTNINSFSGGTDAETDVAFRNRILSAFSGSSVGTALGYLNVALGTTGVSDALVIEPGDTLMTRDGTVVQTAPDGTKTIVSEGSGGKVDVAILGTNLIQNSDSFIFRDKSNSDPTNPKNDFILGQIAGDENKTINKKRKDNIKNGVVPAQPVENILQVTGSISGSNFTPKTVDEFGRIFGNYELIKDDGVYAGSPWSLDKIHWINSYISLFEEDRIKGQPYGQDNTTFTDVLEIPQIQQSLSITNENSIVTSDRSIIQLLHYPLNNVTRVFNVNTGERYVVTNQNFDETTPFNNTGRIKISGNTLPSPSDTLQVDYNWIVDYDQYSDYDGLKYTSNSRPVTDSIDWGYSSLIKNESIKFELSAGNNFFVGTSSHPINTIVSANFSQEADGVVTRVSSGTFVNSLSVTVSMLSNQTTSVDSIIFKNSNTELYVTSQNNGVFLNSAQVVGIDVLYTTTIILPSDSPAKVGDIVTVKLNSLDVFTSDSDSGNSNNNQITIPSSLIDTTASEVILNVTYIASVSDLFSSSVTSLPTSRNGNGYLLSNNNGFNNFSPANISRREHQVIQQNLSSEFYIDLSINNIDFVLTENDIVSVVRLTDGLELWTSDNPGTITTNNSNSYQLIFSGYNSPALNERVLVIYYASEIRRFQPFSFSNQIINTRINVLDIDPVTEKFVLPINIFTEQASGLSFNIYEPNTNINNFEITDGYLESNDDFAFLSSVSQNFATLPSLLNKKVNIINSTDPNNNGIYDIISYDSNTNKIKVKNVLDKISADQICIIRILDGKELWGYNGTVDLINNRILFESELAETGDKVFVLFFNYKNLRNCPTRIVGAISDQIINTGTISVNGTTLTKAKDIIFTAVNTGLKQNLSEAIRKSLSLNSSVPIPSNLKLAKLIKLEKVETVAPNNDEVLSVLTTYDIKNTTIQNNIYYSSDMLNDSTLQNFDFVLSNTVNNSLNTETQNLPKIGDKLRVTFYYVTENDSENLSYTRNGTLYTNKRFALINKIFVNSGFKSSQSTKFTATSFTQPGLGSRYKIFYDYIAPKQNERILIQYNYNKLISDVTFNIENNRPINADVIARGAKLTLLDLTINVVISDAYKNSIVTVLQNLRDQMISAMTTTVMGDVVDTVTLINVAQSVNGVSRARILYFNKTGESGQVLKVQAQGDEYFNANNIIINTETR